MVDRKGKHALLGIPIDAETVLQILEERHAEELFALVEANRRHLRAWLPWLDQNTEVEHTRAFICRSLEQLAAGGGWTWGICHRGRLVGVVGLHFVDQANRRSSIGYWLDEGHQGKGLVTRACAAALDRLFGEMGLNLVEISCAAGNHRSRAIPERLGFKSEAVLRQREWLYDHYVDLVVYSMLAAEWKQARLLAELDEMPRYLARIVAGVSDEAARRAPGGGGLSLVEQAWHLADLEREGYGERIRRLLTEEDPSLPDFDGVRIARERDYRHRSLAEGVAAFAAARASSLARLRGLEAGSWERAGVQEGVGRIRLADVPRMMHEHDAGHRLEIAAALETTGRGGDPP